MLLNLKIKDKAVSDAYVHFKNKASCICTVKELFLLDTISFHKKMVTWWG